jgi:hypothetical protein
MMHMWQRYHTQKHRKNYFLFVSTLNLSPYHLQNLDDKDDELLFMESWSVETLMCFKVQPTFHCPNPRCFTKSCLLTMKMTNYDSQKTSWISHSRVKIQGTQYMNSGESCLLLICLVKQHPWLPISLLSFLFFDNIHLLCKRVSFEIPNPILELRNHLVLCQGRFLCVKFIPPIIKTSCTIFTIANSHSSNSS